MVTFYCLSVVGLREVRSRHEAFPFPIPALVAVDIAYLALIFPENALIKRWHENQFLWDVPLEEVRTLYDEMRAYEAEHGISDEVYSVSETHPNVFSSIRNVFDELMPYLEEALGITPKGSAEKIYAARIAKFG